MNPLKTTHTFRKAKIAESIASFSVLLSQNSHFYYLNSKSAQMRDNFLRDVITSIRHPIQRHVTVTLKGIGVSVQYERASSRYQV